MSARVCFDVAAGMYCDFLNDIFEKEIYITAITATQIGFTAVCFAQDYKQIAGFAKKYGCRIRIIKKRGIFFRTKKLLKHKGAMAGAAAVLVCMVLFSNLIWRIDVIAPTKNITQDVYTLLYQNGFYAGAVFSQEKNQNIIQQIFTNVDNVGYVTLNFYKGILTCKVDGTVNRLPYLENSHTGNIVATRDGVIEKLEVYTGFSDIEIGQSVAAGDLLVSATYIDRNGTLQQVMPRAYIEAHCVKYYSAQALFSKSVRLPTGETTKRVTIKFAGRDFVVRKEETEGYNEFLTEKHFQFVDILGFRLPLTKETVIYHKLTETEVIKDEQSAYTVAKHIVDNVIDNDSSLVTADRREYSQQITTEGVTVICKVTGHYDITK